MIGERGLWSQQQQSEYELQHLTYAAMHHATIDAADRVQQGGEGKGKRWILGSLTRRASRDSDGSHGVCCKASVDEEAMREALTAANLREGGREQNGNRCGSGTSWSWSPLEGG